MTVRKLEVQHFKQVTSGIGPDAEALDRLLFDVKEEEAQRMEPGVANLAVRDTVSTRRISNVHYF